MPPDKLLVLFCVLIVVGATITVPVAAQSNQANGGDRVPVVVVFSDQSAKNPQAIAASDGRVTGGNSVDAAPVLFATVPKQARDAIANRPGVEAVSRDISFTTLTQTTDWGVEEVGAQSTAGGVNESAINVAVIDTGIESQHTDLGDSVEWGANTVGSGYTQGLDSVTDKSGHGTHVGGIITAQDNDRGTVGVAPDASLYAMKALNDSGTGSLSDVIESIDLGMKGPDGTLGTADDADVVSMSLGTETDSPALKRAITSASESAVVVAAAGNAGDGDARTNTVQYPAKYTDTIAVAATDRNTTTPTWSSEGEEVTLAAPGVDVVSTYPGDEYRSLSGTSMATPHVAGTAALYVAATRARTGKDPTSVAVRDNLSDAARDIETAGDDTLSGAGLVQMASTDTETPVGEIVSPASGETVVRNTSITVEARHASEPTENLSVAYAIDDGDWQPVEFDATSQQFTTRWDSSAVADGAHRIWVWIGDSSGDSVNISRPVQVANTNSTPAVEFVTPTDGQTLQDTTEIRLNASDEQTASSDLSVSYRIDNRDWNSLTYAPSDEAYTGEWNTTVEEPGGYTITGYVENADGLADTAQLRVYKENETTAPGEELNSIAELVQAKLDADLQGRAFGQRIAAAASDRERADAAADNQARLTRQLSETLAEPPSQARDVRLRHIQALSSEQVATVRSMPSAVRENDGIDEQAAKAVRDSSRAAGPPTANTPERTVPADRPSRGEQSEGPGESESDRNDTEQRDRPEQGPPAGAGQDSDTGPPADRESGGSSDSPGQSGERSDSSNRPTENGTEDTAGSDRGDDGTSERSPGSSGTDNKANRGDRTGDSSRSQPNDNGSSGPEDARDESGQSRDNSGSGEAGSESTDSDTGNNSGNEKGSSSNTGNGSDSGNSSGSGSSNGNGGGNGTGNGNGNGNSR